MLLRCIVASLAFVDNGSKEYRVSPLYRGTKAERNLYSQSSLTLNGKLHAFISHVKYTK